MFDPSSDLLEFNHRPVRTTKDQKMHKLILTAATLVTAFSGIAYAESPNLDRQAALRQQQAEANQDGPSATATYGFSNPNRVAPVHSSAKAGQPPVGVSPEATELRRTLFGSR